MFFLHHQMLVNHRSNDFVRGFCDIVCALVAAHRNAEIFLRSEPDDSIVHGIGAIVSEGIAAGPGAGNLVPAKGISTRIFLVEATVVE